MSDPFTGNCTECGLPQYNAIEVTKMCAEIERLTMANQMLIRDEKTAAQNVAMLRAEVEHARECFRSCDEQAQRFRAEIGRLAAREVALTELVDGAIKVMAHNGLDVLAEAYRRALEEK